MRIAILGAGPGGYVAALKAAQLGAQVTVIEDTEVGGTCLNRGCIPTKALVASAEAYSKAKGLEEFGIELRGELIPNLHKINERKNKVVSIQVKGIKGLFKSWGVTLKEGRGALLSQKEIEVRGKDSSTEKIEADKIIIATGSRPAQIPSFIFDGKKILSSDDALNLTEIPKSMLIIGAGVIGCEFACIYKELGADVTMVEMMPRAVVTEDMEISGLLEKELKKKKIKLHTNVKVEKVEVKEDGVHAFMSDGKEIIAEKVLVSIGRALNTDGIGLENTGIQKGKRGEIQINEKMETNVPDIYAIGDVTGGMLLAHTASTQGIVTAKNIMGHNEKMDYGTVPAAIFTSPEIASVGLREHQAEEKGLKIRTGHFQFRGLGKAHAMGEIAGFIKVIADEATDKLLGMHIIGPHASDLIHEGAVAIKAGLKVRDIANTIHAHPTLSEGIMEASEDVHNEAVHIPPKK
ncbi:MAG: dihydrolipoyl dehydrogenase [Nitrospirae bacterium RIFOXYB2_FULL_43_5]|nr:MAG: dihydrolipoyl dehydrogenase [Nitrospirae bacterium GWF2_44_13]OGW63930.1 MAG: dihydrolipoyl dehydrogenase [Nitrospirae bacterium RIFOXYA2_FULL_44_9]OGW73920.1 MAG: dihydrolipoyl dehydrogenase [Nitrospirae bacterium RIFOXYB2_FULL_43_5]HBG93216.1 dihydrolipoyl dehydrogenase [Nitrospiraceae bacterium]